MRGMQTKIWNKARGHTRSTQYLIVLGTEQKKRKTRSMYLVSQQDETHSLLSVRT